MRKKRIGVVVSDKPQKTVIVKITQYTKHPLYKKYVKKSAKVCAHDEKNKFKTGEKVEIEQIRPLSKTKRWRVIRKVT